MEQLYEINFSQNVIEAILRRMTQPGYDYVERKKNFFVLTDKVIDTKEFYDVLNKIQQHQELVLIHLFHYVKDGVKAEDIELSFNDEDLKKKFISYLCKYGINVLTEQRLEEVMVNEENDILQYWVGKFIIYCKKNDSTLFQYIEEIVQGAMLANALHVKDDIKRLRLDAKFSSLTVYLDTPLILDFIGISGPARQDAVIEMFDMLHSGGAKLATFWHVFNEIDTVLGKYIECCQKGTLEESYHFEYWISTKKSPMEVLAIRCTLQTHLEGSQIKIVYADANQEKLGISVIEIEEYLKKQVTYKLPTRRKNDISSILSIYCMRSRNDFKRIENCEAVFTTSNHTLCNCMQSYFRDVVNRDDYPAVVDDSYLSSIVLLKSNKLSENYPTLKIVSDAWAAQKPNEDFWKVVMEHIQYIQKEREITAEDLDNMMSEAFLERHVFEITAGDVDKVSHDKITDVINNLSNRNKSEELEQSLITEKAAKYTRGVFLWKILYSLGENSNYLVYAVVILVGMVFAFFSEERLGKMLGVISTGGAFLVILISFVIKFVEKILDKKITEKSSKLKNWFRNGATKALVKKINRQKSVAVTRKDNEYTIEIVDCISSMEKYSKLPKIKQAK